MFRSRGIVRGGTVVAAPDNSALAVAAAALSSGQSASFAAGANPDLFLNDLEWQTNGFYDPTNRLVHLMGKPVGDTAWSHSRYNIDTGAWTTVAGMWNNLGHIYGNTCIDPGTGDIYCARGGFSSGGDHFKQLARWDRATASWGAYAPTAANISANALVDVCNGVSFHPNLYGVGAGGLIVEQQFRTMFWRKSNDTPDDTATHATDLYGSQYGMGVYHPGMAASFVGGAGGNSLLKVTQGPTLSTLSAPPIPIEGNSRETAGYEFGSLHVHPGDASKLILVSTNGTHYWTSTTGAGGSWTDVGTHPYNNSTQFPRVLISMPNYAVIAAYFCTSDGVATGKGCILWKPA
jgi:hypothetical protein